MPQTMQKPLPLSTAQPILRARGITKTYRMGDSDVTVLKGVDLTVKAGEFLAVEGRSGSGKSTLMHLLGALDTTDGGLIEFQERDLSMMSGAERSHLRNTEFGFVFQFYHLLPELNVLENTMLAAMIKYSWMGFRSNKHEHEGRAADLLGRFNMSHRLRHRPNQLSGGERQRVAIARALMNNPKVLFADEPTGNLDFETGRTIMAVIEQLHRDEKKTILMVTHDRSLASQADRVLLLKDGKLANPVER